MTSCTPTMKCSLITGPKVMWQLAINGNTQNYEIKQTLPLENCLGYFYSSEKLTKIAGNFKTRKEKQVVLIFPLVY